MKPKSTKPQTDSQRLPIGINRALGNRLGVAAKLEGKSVKQFAEDLITPAVEATFKRHGLKLT